MAKRGRIDFWPVQHDPPWSKQRRPERRIRVASSIQLQLSEIGESESRTLVGRLVDISPNGFRVRYESQELKPGTLVNAWGRFHARVVWTRALDDSRESGFELVV